MYDDVTRTDRIPFPDVYRQRGTEAPLAYTPLHRPLAHALYRFRLGALCLLVLAGPAVASDTIFGTTRTEIHQQFGAALRDHLGSLVRERGIEPAYHALWGLSSLQFYQMCRLYESSPTGGNCITLFNTTLGTVRCGTYACSHAAIWRYFTVKQMYDQTIYEHYVPGGRRPIRKDITIAGWPVQTTVSEAYSECVLATGDAVQGAVVFVGKLMPVAGTLFSTSYYGGTWISYWIQTYDPQLQEAIGEDIGPIVTAAIETTSDVISAELAIATAAAREIDTLGSPGLNESDFDGLQLGALDTNNLPPN